MHQKNLFLIFSLSLSFFLFSCSKEQDGGVQFRAKTRRGYTYSEFSAGLAYRQYDEAIKRTSTNNINKTLVLSSIPDGKYYWFCYVHYDSARYIIGTKSFGGNVLIEKGKMKDILIEVD